MNIFSLALAIGAGVLLLGGILQGIMAGIELAKHAVGSGQVKRWSVIIVTCIVLAGIFGYASYASSSKSDSPPTSGSPTRVTSSVPSLSPISTVTMQPTKNPTSQPTSTPSPTLSGPKTLPETIRLTCDCSDPVVVTITKIVVEPSQKRMTWSLTFFNNGQSSNYARFDQCFLQKGDQVHYPTTGEQTYDASGQGTGINDVSLHAGETKQVILTFSFVPYQDIPYTLESKLVGGGIAVTFNPEVIQF